MENLTDDSIKEICRKMNVSQLNNFIETSDRNYKLCNEILKEKKKLIEKQLKKYFLKVKILNVLDSLDDLYDVIDLTYMDSNGNGIKIIPEIEMAKLPHDLRSNVPGYPTIYIIPRHKNYILNILNTQDPRL
jgi:hypothetical protein